MSRRRSPSRCTIRFTTPQRHQLIADLLEHQGRSVTYAAELDDLVPKVMRELRSGDLFVTAGAGSIDKLGDKVLAALKALEAAQP